MTKDLLLEIGVEELPARFVPPALEALKSLGENALKNAGLSFKSLRPLGTPRRLVLLVEGLAAKAEDRVHENLGPGVAQAKDKEGNWTPAAQGFARSQGVALESLEVRETERGPRLAAVRREVGLPAEKILPDLLPSLVKAIPFPKNMVWEESHFSFARPIRWLVALYGSKVVPFTLAGVRSGNKTRGLRVHGKGPVPLESPGRYLSRLKDRLVIADPAERRALIERQIHQAVKPVKGRVPLETFADLLDEVTNLVEHPVGIVGSFDPKRLELPVEVLVTSMKKHQKYFPVFDDDGKLLPKFVGIRNGISEDQTVVREGYERVLAARLADAAFFFKEDRRMPLADRVQELKGIAFLAPLTVFDKTERVRKLAKHLGESLKPEETLLVEADRIALLSKADLVTAMVGEFPELQGVMGRIYASATETASVAQGIEEHYWPLTADGPLPRLPAAALVSIADKLDSLAGNFLAENIPSGSQDPYGLRRSSVGLLRILKDRGWSLNLGDAGNFAMTCYGNDNPLKVNKLGEFMRQRWSALQEAAGFRVDAIRAVLVSCPNCHDPLEWEGRLRAVADVLPHPDFGPLVEAFKRASNILKQAEEKKFISDWRRLAAADLEPESNYPHEAEKILYRSIREAQFGVEPFLKEKKFSEALRVLVRFREPVGRFFKEVMVMDPDERTRTNRLALLAKVQAPFWGIADLSQLQGGAPAGEKEAPKK